METTVTALRELLEALEADGFGDAPVRVAHQLNWTLAEDISCIDLCDSNNGVETVWLACNGSKKGNPYAPRRAFEEYEGLSF